MSESSEPVAEGLTRKAVHGTGWSALGTAAKQLLAFASVAVLARLLGPSVYGLMGMATLILIFLTNFRDLGTAAAIVQRPQISQRLVSSLFWVNCGLGILLFFVIFVAAVPVAHFFHEPRLTPILRVVAFSFCFTTVGMVPNALLVRRMDFRSIAFADFTSTVAGYVVSITCAFAGLGVWSLVFANLVNTAAATSLYIYFSTWRPTLEFDRHEVRSVAHFSLNFAGFGLVNYFGRNADNIIVGRWLGDASLGNYQMAYNLFLFPIQNITSVISQVLNPAFAKIQNDNERFRHAYVRSCMIIALITFPVLAGFGVVADPFVRVVLGKKWLPVIPLLWILLPVGLFQSVQTTVGQIYVAKGRTNLMLRVGIYSSTVAVIAFLIGVRWGIFGVAAAYAIVYFTLLLYPNLWLGLRLIELPVGRFFILLLPQLCITVAMVAICIAWQAILRAVGMVNSQLQLFSTIAIGVLSYGALVLRFRPLALAYFESAIEHSHLPGAHRILRITRAFST